MRALHLLAAVLLVAAPASAAQSTDTWPSMRGPLGTGVAPQADPPVAWSEEQNVRWKVALPGGGHSSPIVWGDRILLTAAVPHGDPVPRPDTAPGAHDNLTTVRRQQFTVLAVRRADGAVLWQRVVADAFPHEGGHTTGTHASASPVTDGEHVFASFGSIGLFCLDLEGELVWSKDLGDMQTKHGHGEGSSPALHGDTLIVNWDHEGPSFVVALDKRTGEELWRTPRDEPTSWASPIVVEHGGKALAVVSGTNRIRAYDLATGDVLWECGGMSHNVVATPVAADGMVFAASSYERQALVAIRLEGARGDLTETDRVAWVRRRRTPYVPSPLLYDGWLYVLHHYQGAYSRVDAATGEEPKGPFRLDRIDDVYASPVAAAGRVYVTDRQGMTVVLEDGDEPRPIAWNRLEDAFSATAAIVGEELVLRGERYLYCIAEE